MKSFILLILMLGFSFCYCQDNDLLIYNKSDFIIYISATSVEDYDDCDGSPAEHSGYITIYPGTYETIYGMEPGYVWFAVHISDTDGGGPGAQIDHAFSHCVCYMPYMENWGDVDGEFVVTNLYCAYVEVE